MDLLWLTLVLKIRLARFYGFSEILFHFMCLIVLKKEKGLQNIFRLLDIFEAHHLAFKFSSVTTIIKHITLWDNPPQLILLNDIINFSSFFERECNSSFAALTAMASILNTLLRQKYIDNWIINIFVIDSSVTLITNTFLFINYSRELLQIYKNQNRLPTIIRTSEENIQSNLTLPSNGYKK
ncbi:hypothetical protein AGLY_017238 [Aphis glycines]|uniref:Uncharacterized protein n=1 Tax=Aphis glycines TaxID=307491 RepID=A0A6G0SVE2_APHGL|nr:hypothetical protein AGLY_017238 [Aphis glycines]